MLTQQMLSLEQRAAIGDLVAESAWLEHIVNIWIEYLTKLKPHAYAALVEGIMLGRKLEILKTLGEHRIRSVKKRKIFGGLINKIKSLNDERAIVVHGYWQPKGGHTLAWLAMAEKAGGPMEVVLQRRLKQDKSLDVTSRVAKLADEFHASTNLLLRTGLREFRSKRRE